MRLPGQLWFGAALSAVFIAAALISFLWTPYAVDSLAISQKLKVPNAQFWLGTDHFGRDILSMLMVGARVSIDGAMFGYGTPIGTHFAPHNPDYVDLTGQSAYDPEMSKALLAEAGVSDLTLTLKLPPPSYARRGGEIIASQLREVGIETEISNLEWAQWLEQVFKGKDYDLTIVSHTEPMDINIYAASLRPPKAH